MSQNSIEQLLALSMLADGIIPPDKNDAGASAVDAGQRLNEKIAAGINKSLYLAGLAMAAAIATEKYSRKLSELTPAEIHEVLGGLRDRSPDFFKQLRMDVSALYLSDPTVWARIGFPGPSTQSGGYPDFDQPQ